MVKAVPDYVLDEVSPVEVVLLMLFYGDSLCRVEECKESNVTLPVLTLDLRAGSSSTKGRDSRGVCSPKYLVELGSAVRVCHFSVRPGDVGADDLGGVGVKPVEKLNEF